MRVIEPATYRSLDIRRDGDVMTVVMLERGRAMHTELARVFVELRADPCRVVVLTGRGEHFLGAVNLSEYLATTEEQWQQTMS